MNTPEPWTVDYQCEFYSANKVSIEFVSVSQYIMNIHLPRLILLKYLRRKLSRINKLSGRINNIEDFQEETHSQTIAYLWHQKEDQIYHGKPLRKHAYSNILKSLPPKKWKFSDKNLCYFSYFCSKHRLWHSLEPPRRGGSNEYPQSMFLSRNKKHNVYPCKPQFLYIKVGIKGVKII